MPLEVLKKLMWENIEESDFTIVFDHSAEFDAFIDKFFSKHYVTLKNGVHVRVKSMSSFFWHDYMMKVDTCQILQDGINFALEFMNQVHRKLLEFDSDKDWTFTLDEFKELLL